MDKKIIDLMETQKPTERGELELTCALKELIGQVKVNTVKVNDYWLPIGYPWHIIEANEVLLSKIKEDRIAGEIIENVHIDGTLVLGEGSVILPGVYIEGTVMIGKNCKIGPNCYIRGSTTIGDNCRVGQGVEIKNSVIGDKTNVPHLSYVGDSVIGDKANIGAGTNTSNLRHDNANIKTMVNGNLVDTGRRKLGTIIADGVHTGINTSIYPGRKFWPNTTTKPGEVVKKDVMNDD